MQVQVLSSALKLNNARRRPDLATVLIRYLVLPAAVALPTVFDRGLNARAAEGPAEKNSVNAANISAEDLDRLILQLGDDDMAKRVKARERLEAIGEPAVAKLKTATEVAEDPEVRSGARIILEKLDAKARGLLHEFRGSLPKVHGIAIAADGKRAVSAGWDGALRYWDLEQFILLRQIAGHGKAVLRVALSPDGRMALSGSLDKTMKLWDLGTGSEVRSFAAHPNAILALALSPDGKTALSGCVGGNARLWDVATGKVVRTLETGENDDIWAIAFTPDGKQVVTGGRHFADPKERSAAFLCLWDLATGKQVRRIEGHSSVVSCAAVSPDGKRLLSTGAEGAVRLCELGTGKELKRFGGPESFRSVVFTAAGKRANGSYDPGNEEIDNDNDPRCSLKLWDLATGNVVKRFDSRRSAILCFAVSADERRLISGCADGSMCVWELPR